MGKQSSKPIKNENSGGIVNEIQIHQAEIVNSEIPVILYCLLLIQILQLLITFYKMWKRNLKKRYLIKANQQI